jgi:hypothetical protein
LGDPVLRRESSSPGFPVEAMMLLTSQPRHGSTPNDLH